MVNTKNKLSSKKTNNQIGFIFKIFFIRNTMDNNHLKNLINITILLQLINSINLR